MRCNYLTVLMQKVMPINEVNHGEPKSNPSQIEVFSQLLGMIWPRKWMAGCWVTGIGFTWLQARSIPFPWLFSAWNSRKLAGCYLWQGKKHSDMGPGIWEWMLHAWQFLWRKWWQTRRQLWDNSSFQPKVNVLYFGRGPLKHCSMTCQTWRPLGGLELVCRCRKTSCLLAAHWYLNMPQGPQGVALSTSKKEPDSMHQDWARRSSVPSTSSTPDAPRRSPSAFISRSRSFMTSAKNASSHGFGTWTC